MTEQIVNDFMLSPEEKESLPSDRPLADAALPEEFHIAKPWRRIVAALIDIVVLALMMTVLHSFLDPVSFRLGPWGRLLGLVVGTVYLGVLNSRMGHGKTFGKLLFNLKTVDQAGYYLSPAKAIGRGALLSFFFTQSQIGIILSQLGDSYGRFNIEFFRYNLDSAIPIPVLGSLFWALAMGGLTLILIGYLFNKETRQGPHDLLFGSYVVVDLPSLDAAAPINKPAHRNIAIGCFALSILLGIVLGLGMLLFENVLLQSSNMTVLREVMADEHVLSAAITFDQDQNIHVNVRARGSCYPVKERCYELFEKLAQIVTNSIDTSNASTLEVGIIAKAETGWITFERHEFRTWKLAD